MVSGDSSYIISKREKFRISKALTSESIKNYSSGFSINIIYCLPIKILMKAQPNIPVGFYSSLPYKIKYSSGLLVF